MESYMINTCCRAQSQHGKFQICWSEYESSKKTATWMNGNDRSQHNSSGQKREAAKKMIILMSNRWWWNIKARRVVLIINFIHRPSMQHVHSCHLLIHLDNDDDKMWHKTNRTERVREEKFFKWEHIYAARDEIIQKAYNKDLNGMSQQRRVSEHKLNWITRKPQPRRTHRRRSCLVPGINFHSTIKNSPFIITNSLDDSKAWCWVENF